MRLPRLCGWLCLPALALGWLAAAPAASAQGVAAEINPGTPWPATDGLGRELPLAPEVGAPRSDRFVGIFYFLTHAASPPHAGPGSGPRDVARVLAADPQAAKKPQSPLWGGIGESHYWGEPIWGYYQSTDPWVLRRQARMLADAGIDTLIFDTTNAQTYREVYLELLRIFRELRQAGGRAPQVAFMVNTQAGETAAKIYHDLYEPGLYPELWFRWQGKPLMICDPAAATPECKAFFTLRRAHWPFTLTNTPYAWHWEATYPQPFGYTDDPAHPEQVNVSVAQNLRARDGKVTNMSFGDARGRSFHDGVEDKTPGAVNLGWNFQEQWRRAFDLAPPFAMVTGWNEWTARRWGDLKGPLVFVDQFDEEFSRDIEPVKGGHGDNYYWQLVANVRRFKGAPPVPAASAPRTIRLDAGEAQWREVGPEYASPAGLAIARDHDGTGGLHYMNQTGRNEVASAKVARDGDKVWFQARTVRPLTPAGEPGWMWLLIDTDQNPKTGWEGFDVIVNRLPAGAGKASVERNAGGWKWERLDDADLRVEGSGLQVAIPRESLGMRRGETRTRLDFKWADNLQRPGDVMDFYVSGCCAPLGRFKYRYSGE